MTQAPPNRYKAVALDVDGTITDSTHAVRPRAIDAIKWLERRGIPVVILTGRRAKPVLELAAECGIARPMVTDNGSTIIDTGTGKVIKQEFAPSSLGDDVFGLCEKFDLGLAIWTDEAIYAHELNVYTRILGEMAGDEVQVADLSAIPSDRVFKYNLYGSEERLDEVQPYINAHHPEVRRSAITFYETATPGATKWEGLQFCLKPLGIDPSEVVGVADGENDLDFIEGVGLGVAVENAYPRLKEVAQLQIGRADEDATAIFLEELFGRQPGE